MAAFTHVLEYDGGIFTREIGPSADLNVFADCAATAGSIPGSSTEEGRGDAIGAK